MKEPKSYTLVLKYGEPSDRFIRGISVAGGLGIMETLKNNPPPFIEIKGTMVATNAIVKLVPIYTL